MNIKSVITLLRHVTIMSFEKGEVLIPEGTTDQNVYFIRKGLVRSFYINDNVEQKTFQLYPEYSVVLNIHSVLLEEPSRFTYQTIEPTKAYRIEYKTFLSLSAQNPKLLAFNREHIGRRAMRTAFQRIESFVFMSPEERYLQYLKEYPNVVNRAPDKYIANVLGITPVSLSRIRGRMAAKKK